MDHGQEVRKDGIAVWTRVTTRLQRDSNGCPLQFLTHVEGIDNQRRVEQALRESEMRARETAQALREAQDRLEHVLTSSPAVLYSLRPTPKGFVANWVSKNLERLLGYSVDEVLPEDWWPSHLHPEDRERALSGHAQSVQQAVAPGYNASVTVFYRIQSG